MCLTNHKDGRESLLSRAPTKDRNSSLLNPFSLIPLLAVLATGDAVSGIVDPSLPQFLSVAAVTSLAVGTTLNTGFSPVESTSSKVSRSNRYQAAAFISI